ncbi:MAG: transglycosylase SLT domain-containing protein [Pseudobdellovibrionaceae bacterium]
MRQLKILFSFLLLFSAGASAQEPMVTPAKKDFTENGVPFVVDSPGETEETPRTEAGDKPAPEAEAEDSTFTPVTDEDTPVSHEDVAGEKNLTTSRPWKSPDFSNQEGALGYSPQTFAIPKGLEVNFKFWLNVYSKYTTDQGVLHDSDYMDLIYEELDFTDISSRTDLNPYQKEALKIKKVKEAKKRTVALLEKFKNINEPSSLNFNERKIWDYFAQFDDPKKFTTAAKKSRLRFQLGQKDRIIQGIYFSGRYLDEFEKIFREAGLPIELVRLPFVESSYNVLARSKVGASGLWQIMPYTMRGFMKRDPAIDLRNHPAEAARLAAKLLRINYKMLESWPLALTGYNHGPSGVLRISKKAKTRDIGELVSQKKFGFASRNFYASFLAALEVTSNAQKYLGSVSWSQPLESHDVKLPLAIKYRDLLRWFDGDDLKTQVFNPHITKLARTRGRLIPKNVIVSIPKVKSEMIAKELESPEALRKAQATAEAEGRAAPASEDENQPFAHRVKRGENIKKIAEEYGISIQEIRKLNKLKKNSKLRTGQVLLIP